MRIIARGIVAVLVATLSVVSLQPTSVSAAVSTTYTRSLKANPAGGSEVIADCGAGKVLRRLFSYFPAFDGSTSLGGVYGYCYTVSDNGLQATTSETAFGPYGTSTSGSTSDVSCPTTQAIIGATVYKTSGGYTRGVTLKCGTLPYGTASGTTLSLGGSSYTSGAAVDIDCATGEIATGLWIWYGGILDTFGLRCGYISGGTQSTLTVTTTSAVYGTNTTLTTSGGLGSGAVTYTKVSGNCTISGSTLSPTGVGPCVVNATKAADTNYVATTSANQTVTIAQRTPTFSWSNVSKTFGDASFTLTAPTVTNGVTGTWTYASSNTSVVSLSGAGNATATVAGAGSSTITGTFTPTDTTNNVSGGTVTMTVTVAQASQTITFADPADRSWSSTPINLSPTASSGLGVTLTSNTSSVCTVSTFTVTMVTSGTCTLTASQAGNTNYSAAANVQQSFVISPTGRSAFAGNSATISGTNTGTTYVVERFTSSSSWTAPGGVTSVDVLAVGGGGGGGGGGFTNLADSGGGGGGGAGAATSSTANVSAGTAYPVVIGSGGGGGTGGGSGGWNGNNGAAGTASSAIGISAAGGNGGCGAAWNASTTSCSASSWSDGTGGFGGVSGSSQAGGSRHAGVPGGGGGGGGSSAAGSSATNATGASGGAGTSSSITGSSTTYATGGVGGNGGAGGTSGTTNTTYGGGGGGGNGENGQAAGGTGATGTSGFVVIRYALPAVTAPDLASGSDTGTSSTDNLTNATTLTFTGTAPVGSTVQLSTAPAGTSPSSGTWTDTGSSCVADSTSGAWSCTTASLTAASYAIRAVATSTYDGATTTQTSATALDVTVDSSSPTASVTTASITASGSVSVQSTETGTAYLVRSSVSVATLANITGAADNNWNSIAITTANTATALAATGLIDGTYRVYAVDAAGNLSAVSTNSVTIDSTAPSVSLAASPTSVTASSGQTSTITFTVSESVTTFSAADVSTTFGTISNFSGSGTTYTATFTPTRSSSGPAVITVAAGGITDGAGNANAATTLSIPITATNGRTTYTANGTNGTNGTNYIVERYTTTGASTWTAPRGVTAVDLLVIGGGGGAGSRGAGGGGAGGYVEANSYAVTAGSTYNVTVGAGGAGVAASTTGNGAAGSASSFLLSSVGLTANGGGGGNGHGSNTASGGNSGSGSGTGGTAYQNNGALGRESNTCGSSDWCGGGGGGAGSAGGAASSGGGTGGAGRASSITGTSVTYAGGGGGGGGSSGVPSNTPSPGGSAGAGGGGAGGTPTWNGSTCLPADGTSGTNGLGGGGGGGAYCDSTTATYGQGTGGSGGSGIVIIRYALPSITTPDLDAASDLGTSTTDNKTSDTTPTFSGSAPVGSAVQLYVDGTASGSVCYTNDTTGLWSCTTATLSSGTYSITAIASTTLESSVQTSTSSALSVSIDTYTITYDSQGGSSVNSAQWTAGTSFTLPTPTRAGYTFSGWSTSSTGSRKVYETTQPYRTGNNIVYASGYGKGVSDAAATLTSAGATFDRVRYRMEANYSGTLRYADVSFDKWSGATISSLAVPDLGDARTIKTNVTNLAVDSNWPGFASAASSVTTGTAKTGRVEFWPWDYTQATSGSLASPGSGAIFDSDDTSAGTGSYGSFQIHNLTDSQTVLAWNSHYDTTPDIGFGNFLGTGTSGQTGNTDWTFAAQTNFDLATWKLGIYVGDLHRGGITYTPTNTADFTLYAQWTADPYSVTYNGNSNTGGTVPTDATVYNYGNTVTVRGNTGTLTNTGYTFSGWCTTQPAVGSACSGTSQAAASTFTITGNTTLYAVWLDTTAPTVTSFSSSTADGSYTTGQSINITATTSEAIRSGNTITVTLDTGATVTLTAASAGTTLTGTYTIASGQNSADLTVSSFTIGTVADTAGNAMTSTTVPTGVNNIAGAEAIIVDSTGPAAPTSLSATNGVASATISFTPGVGGPSPVTNYKYSIDGTTYTALSPADTTSPVTISGLTNGTTYSITLKTVTAIGDSPASAAVSVTPRTTPSAPNTPTVTGGDGQATVTWTAPTNGGAAISGYNVQYSTALAGTYLDATGTCAPASRNSSTALSCIMSGLTNNTTYYFKVAAKNEAGFGSYSAAGSGTAIKVVSLANDYALNLDGSTHVAAMLDPGAASVLDLDNFTIEAWVYPTSNTVESMIMNKESAYELAIKNGDLQYAIASSAGSWAWNSTSLTIATNTWTHIAFTKSGNTVTAYLNGVQRYTLTSTSAAPTDVLDSSAPFSVGGRASVCTTLPTSCTYGSLFLGRLNDARLWSGSRTASQIAAFYDERVASNLGTWLFDENGGAIAYNSARTGGSALNLTLSGTPSWTSSVNTSSTRLAAGYNGSVSAFLPGYSTNGNVTFSKVANSETNGTVSITAATGAFTFTPTSGQDSLGSFDYVASYSTTDSTASTYTIGIPSAPSALALTPVGGTNTPGYLNSTNTNVTASVTIDGTYTAGGRAELYVDGTLKATDSTIASSDTTASFSLGTATNAALSTAIGAPAAAGTSKSFTVKLFDMAGNVSNESSATTVIADFTAPTITSFSSSTSDGTYGVGGSIAITATASEAIRSGNTITATLNSGATVALTASAAGTTFSGTYTVAAGQNSTDLTVSSFTIGTVADTAGNTMTSTTVPSGTSNLAGTKAIVIDTTGPAVSSFTSAQSTPTNVSSFTYTLTFAEAVTGVVAGDFANTGTATSCSFAPGTDTSGTTRTVTVSGCSDGTVIPKFLAAEATDTVGNTGPSADATATTTITVDTAAPTISSFSSSTANGSYKAASTVNITATTNEAIRSGNTITVTLDTGATVTLTAASAGTTLTGTYTVGASQTSADLTVSSFTIGTVLDTAGNAMTSTSVPSGSNNIAGAKAIVIDTTAPTVDSFVSADSSPTASTTLTYTITFSEAVTGVAAGDFSNSGAATGCSFAPGTDTSGTTRTVTITSCSEGTVIPRFAINGASDAAGNAGPASAATATTTITRDTSAPTYVSSAVNSAGTQLTLTYSETLNSSTAPTSAFAVINAGIPNPVSSVSISGSTIVLTLTETVHSGQTVTFTYTDPTAGNDAGAIQDPAGNDAVSRATATTATNGATGTIPRAARLIGLGTETVVTVSGLTGGTRGITSDGTYVYFRNSGDLSKIYRVAISSISTGATATATATSWTVRDSSGNATTTGNEQTQLVYSSGCIFYLAVEDNTGLRCIDVSTGRINSVTIPAGKNLPSGKTWLLGNLVSFPDGRIGKLSAQTLVGSTYVSTLRLYTVSGTGSNATLEWSEDMTLNDTVDFPSDDHGFATDGVYGYRINHAAGYKVWRLQSGAASNIIFNGNGNGTCTSASGTLCNIAISGISNATYIGYDAGSNRYFVGDYTTNKFYMTESQNPGVGPGTAPITVDSFSSAVSSPTTSPSPAFTLTFNTAVTGVTAADFTNSGSATCTFAVSAVSTSVYTVTPTCDEGTVRPQFAANGAVLASNGTSTGPAFVAAASTTVTVAVAPTIVSFTSTKADGSYKAAATVNITATTSETIQSGSTMTVTLNASSTAVTLTAAAQGTTLTGTYTVASGNNAADLTVSSYTVGTVTDLAGNAMTSTALPAGANIADTSNIVIDTTAPTISSFSSSTANGTYGIGGSIAIAATASETIGSGNTITVTLNSGTTVALTAAAAGTTLSGTYTVAAGQNSSDLTVSSFTIGSVSDVAGNPMTSTTVPSGTSNIAGAKALVVDTTAPSAPTTLDLSTASDTGTGSADDITGSTTPTISVASLESGASVTISATKAPTTETCTFTASSTTGSCALANITEGTWSITATQTDPVGNQSVGSSSLTIYVDTTGPAAPTGLSATVSSGTATISFTPGSGGPSAVTNYRYSTDGLTYTALSPADTTSPISISGLTNGTTYSIRLKTVTAMGDSPASSAVSAKPSKFTGLATISYTEQDPAIEIAPSVEISGGTSYDGKYIDFEIGSPQATELLGYRTVATATTTNGVVSIVGTSVYLGNGTTADPIGSIDATRNGQNGQPLRINFTSSFSNAGFESGTLSPWTAVNSRIDLGVTSIAGFTTSDTSTYSTITSTCKPSNDNRAPTTLGTLSVATTTSTKSEGSYSLQLSSSGMTVAGGGDVVHGPAVYSDTFQAAANDVIYFDWQAQNGGDYYHVLGYILNTVTGAQTEVLDSWGNVTTWATAQATIPTAGTYRFVFVSGTQDFSCYLGAGASLYIDNVRVFGSKVDDAVATKVAQLVTYRNTSDAPATSRTVTLTTNPSGGTATTTFNIAVTATDDAPSLGSTSQSYTNAESSAETFTPKTGTLAGTDPDGDTLTYSLPNGTAGSTTYSSVTYDAYETGTYGTLWIKSTTGQYYYAPNNTAINNRLVNDSEAFDIRVTATSVDADSTFTLAVSITAAAPAAPTGLSVTPGVRALNVSWTAPTWIGGSAVTGYRIEYSTNNSIWTTASDNSSTSTSLRITGVVDATAYYVRVASKNTNGTGTYSSSAPTTYSTFDKPTSLTLTPVGGTVVSNTLNLTNTNLTAQATIVAGRLTGGTATLYRGSTAVATDTSIGAADTTVDFDLSSSTTAELQALVASGGTMTVKVVDANGVETLASAGVTLTVDYVRPSVTITRSGTGVLNQGASDVVTFTLSESSSNFVVGDIGATGGTLSAFSGSGSAYTATFTVSAGATGSATISVLGSALTDAAGNGNSASNTLSITLNSAPTLATPATVSFSDTIASDTFANTTGTLSGTDVDSGDTLTYGLVSGADGGTTVSRTGTYGTLTITKATGAYVFSPNNSTINTRSTNASETFTVNVTDGIQTTVATFTVSITATNDAPVMTDVTSNLLDTAANDAFSVSNGTFSATDIESNTISTWGITGSTTGSWLLTWTSGSVTFDRRLTGSYGTLYVRSSTGQYRFEPNNSAINALSTGTSETFPITVADNLSALGTGAFVASITAVNDRPLATVTVSTLSDVTAGLPTSSYSLYHPTAANGGSSPGGEEVYRAFDDSTGTKYLNFSGAGSGVTLDLGSGVAYAVTGLGLTTANDASERDPTSYEISGSNDGSTFTVVSQGSLSAPSGRLTAYADVTFTNATNYRWYRVAFPQIRSGGNPMQVSEIRLPARSGNPLTYTEGAPAGVVLTGIDVTDADTASLSGATVSITAGLTTGDQLAFNNDGSTMGPISGSYNPGSGVLTLSGTATPSEYQNAFRSITFRNTTNNPTATSSTRTVTWQVDDSQASNNLSTASTSTITVIETAATVSSVALTSTAGPDNSYAIGDTINATVTFSEAVTVSGAPRLPINGLSGRNLVYTSGSGSTSLSFEYTVVESDLAASGIGIVANSLTLNGGTINDSVNAAATISHNAVAIGSSHSVDGVRPAVSSFTSSTANGSYKAGDAIAVSATVNESVQAGSSIVVTFDTGATATLTAASAGTTLTGTYTIAAPQNSTDLTVSSFTITSVLDAAGNAMTTTTLPLGISNIAAVKTIVIDTIAPTITQMTVSASGSYKAGQTITVTATASEALRAGNTIILTFDTGETLTLTAASAGTTLTGTYIVQAGINSTDLTVSAFSLGTVLDTAGNAMTSTTLPTGANAIGPGTAVVVDTIAPTLTSFTSTTPDGPYKAGQTINITATVSEPINTGNSIAVTLNSGAAVTISAPGSGTTLVGTYTIAAGQNSVALSVSSFTVVSVLDGAGNSMTSTTIPSGSNITDTSGIIIDTAEPTVLSFSTTAADGAYKAGQTISLTATVSEPILSGNGIVATLNSGANVTMTAASAGSVLTATYTIGSGENSGDLTVTSFVVGSVSDPAGNAMTSTAVPSGANNIGAVKAIVIDTTAPVITAFASTIPSPTNLTTLSYTLTFSESVTGIDGNDFSNSGSASGCSFNPGTDTGSTRTVTITMCGGGTVTPVFSANGAVDVAANSTQATAATSTSTINRRFIRTISFAVTSFAKTYGDAPFNVSAAPSLGAGDGPVTYTVTAGTCSVGSATGEVTITGAGSCTVSATVAEGTNNQSATTSTLATITIAKKTLAVTASSHALTYGDTAPTITPSYSAFAYNETAADLTTLPTCASPYTPTSTALVNLATTCSGAASPNYEITYSSGTITIAKQPTTVTFASVSLSQIFNGNNRAAVATTSPANKNLVFTYVGPNHNSTTAPVNVGSYTVTATVTEANFTGSATATLLITKANQTAITFANPSSVPFGTSLQLVAVGGNGSGALAYTMRSGSCAVSATGMVTNSAAGPCVLSATRAESMNYVAASSADTTITITKQEQSVSFTSAAPSNPTAGGTYVPTATATSGLAVSISITTGENTSCSLANGTVTFITSGTCVLTAKQAGNANFNPADVATQTIAVGSLNQTISFTQPSDKRIGDPAFQLEASSSGGVTVSFAATGGACAVSPSGLVTLVAPGTCDVTASSGSDGKYAAATSVTRTIIVRAGLPGVPHLMSASPGDSSIMVAYSVPPTDGGSSVVSYVVVATPTSGDPVIRSDCSTTTLNCELVGLINGMGYKIKVAAVTAAAVGEYSAETDPVTPFVAPEAVRDLTGVREEQSLLVEWDDPESLGGGTLVRYDVSIREKDGSFGTPVQVSAANIRLASVNQRAWNHTFRNLSKAKVYEVKIVTITSLSATSTPTNTAQALIQRMNVAEAPRNLTLEATSENSAVATWATPLRDGGSPITSYSATSSNGTCTSASSTALSCSLTNLAAGKAITVTVKAVTVVGSSEASTATISLPGRPGAPTIESVIRKGSSATITWKAPASDGGRPVTSYRIVGLSSLDAKDVPQCSSTALSCTVQGLSMSAAYNFTARAFNVFGEGAASAAYFAQAFSSVPAEWGSLSAPATRTLAGLPPAPGSVKVLSSSARRSNVIATAPKTSIPITHAIITVAGTKGRVVLRVKVAVNQANPQASIKIPYSSRSVSVSVQFANAYGVSAMASGGWKPAPQITRLTDAAPNIQRGVTAAKMVPIGTVVGSPVYFIGASSQLSAAAKAELSRIATQIKRDGGIVNVTGYARFSRDTSVAFMKKVSEQRALVVANYLAMLGVQQWIRFQGVGAPTTTTGPDTDRRVVVSVTPFD